MHLTLIPVFGLAFSAVLLGDRLTTSQIAGTVLVLGTIATLTAPDVRSDRERRARTLEHHTDECT